MSGAGVPEAQAQTGERVGAEADTTEVVKEADGEGIVEGHVDTSASAGAGTSEIDAKVGSAKVGIGDKDRDRLRGRSEQESGSGTKEESEMNIMTGAGAEVNDEGIKVEEGQANTEEVRSGAGVEAKEEANPGAVPVADGQVAAGQEEEKGEGVAVIATQSKALEDAEDIPAATIAPETKDPVSVPELTEAAHAPSTENSDSITLKQALDTSTPPPLAPAPPPTWEERTWKELVRLREVMFWARVGVAEA
ncbi:hypothetical protein BT96DRAFT_997621 [Gymnopus androsaceus JB14]|uniref:Uncharacterized protein n=1 Tax=Gymnopus androsaceus JB14 TaxID=1447944 RepID=A0A6A4HB57_9AGAR|nr:hypothetical protein BT96DRAFT_997621 [Gymnopus androsaceus JB14]